MPGHPSSISPRPVESRAAGGFSLVEMLVSITLLLILMGVLLAVTQLMTPVLKTSGSGISSFQQARSVFEAMTQTLSQATLMTYSDYVDSQGDVRTPADATTFVPIGLARTSELHFISGYASTLVPGGGATTTPGEAVFFQAPLGWSTDSAYQPLESSLNEVGFYVSYSYDGGDWPAFTGIATKSDYRFRLMEWLPQTQNIGIYNSTIGTSSTAPVPAYNLNWIDNYLPTVGTAPTAGQDAPLVLAENVVLLVILPKLTPEDETQLAGSAPAYPGTSLCPTYRYDSRAWETSYSGPVTGSFAGVSLASMMRNQLPPLVEVVMVAISDKDMLRLQQQHGDTATPPPELDVSQGAFQDSTKLDSDLLAYETQLTSYHITYKSFQSTVQLKGARWTNY